MTYFETAISKASERHLKGIHAYQMPFRWLTDISLKVNISDNWKRLIGKKVTI